MADLTNFDPSGVGLDNGNLYGLPFSLEDARVIVIPVPWEVTVSYGAGTASGPEAVVEASRQVDLYDSHTPAAWEKGIAMLDLPEELRSKGEHFREQASMLIEAWEKGRSPERYRTELGEIEKACKTMVEWVRIKAREVLEQNKIPVVLGGDHSTPLGLMQALGERYPSYGILQIDAHCDLRNAYESFRYSHASIMYNALEIPSVTKLVQVGIRDYCEEEVAVIDENPDRIVMYTDRELASERFGGESWASQVKKIVEELPEKVYISFDIDGLDPALCPNTGTPVPGGLQYEEALYLLGQVSRTGRHIIGFDLCEVSPGKDDDWDATVGARVLYRMFNLAVSQTD